MERVMAFIRAFPAGPAKYCWISYKEENLAAKNLYESFGFRNNGEVIHEEQITVHTL